MRFAPLVLNFALMVSLPVLLGWLIAGRRRVSWRYFGIGMLSFILAQVGHIPFNYMVNNSLLAEMTLASEQARMIVTAAFLGLSAALFEEGMRYLTFRFWAKDARTWGRGLMMGAGHGGVESILLGLLGALNVTILFGYQAGYFQGLIPTEQASQVGQALDQLAALPWYEMMFGALERIFALSIQLSLSLLVMQLFVRGKLRWLLVAFSWHALIDATAVIALDAGGAYAAEAVAGVAALISLVIIAMLRAPEPKPASPGPMLEPGRAQPIQIKPTKEKLEDSRYI
ncbi:MAG: YhfC family glutamic-type intramembrane protease [Chloroflexota bacterium]|jgi:uncharacterized membrane protein YhfC